MQRVTDNGTDSYLPPEQVAELNIHIIPLIATLKGKSHRESVGYPTGGIASLGASDRQPPYDVAALGKSRTSPKGQASRTRLTDGGPAWHFAGGASKVTVRERLPPEMGKKRTARPAEKPCGLCFAITRDVD